MFYHFLRKINLINGAPSTFAIIMKTIWTDFEPILIK